METIRQKLLVLWANNLWHHAVKVAVKGVLGVVLIGGTAAPVLATTTQHWRRSPPHPVHTVVTQKVAAKPAPQNPPPAAPAAAPPTPAPAAAPAPAAPAPPPPAHIPASLPSPGSGAKKLVPSAPAAPAGTTPAPPASGNTPPAATGGYTSTNWAGYVATAGGYTGVSGSWRAPSATGNGSTTSADSSWIGIGGVFSNDLIQTGTMNIVAASGHVSTYAFYELLPDSAILIPSLTVTPGDNISATISQISSGQWTISISDTSTGQSFSINVSYTSTFSTAEWIEEDPSYGNGAQIPFDNFGPAVFSSGSATKNGGTASIAALGSQPINMVTAGGQPVATTSILTGGGTGFTVTKN